VVRGRGDALVSAFSVAMELWALDVKDQLQERNPVSSLVVDVSVRLQTHSYILHSCDHAS
jgi:hypothetical protein